MEQAVQTASAHLPAPAPVGRRSPVSTRPLPSTSQKPIENQEHRRGRTLAVYYFLIDRSASSIQLIFIKKIYFMWNDPRRCKLNLRECSFSLSNSTQSSDGGGVIWIFGFVCFSISDFPEVFDYVSHNHVSLSVYSIAEVHKVSRPENEQLRNDSKRQIGKLLHGSESLILCFSIKHLKCMMCNYYF